MKFIFYITDDWDEGRKELESMPMTLGDLIDNNPIEFTDGTKCDWNDLDWETCEVKVKLLESKQEWKIKSIKVLVSFYLKRGENRGLH